MNPEARCRAGRPCLEGSKSRNRLSELLAWPVFFLLRAARRNQKSGGDMRASRYSVRLLVLSGAIVLGCREDEVARPSLAVAPSSLQRVEVTEARLAIEKLQLIGATEDTPAFSSMESFAVSVNLGGAITRLKSFSVP